MKTEIALRAPTWPLVVAAALGLLAAGIASADAADYPASSGWELPPGHPPVYGPRPYRHREVAAYAAEPMTQFDDPTADFVEALDLQPSPPAADVIARRERALPVGVIYNVPSDPFLARRRYGPVIRANY